MNHRRECERIDRTMSLGTACQLLGLKRKTLDRLALRLASERHAQVIRGRRDHQAVEGRNFEQLREARTVILQHLEQLEHGLQLSLWD